MQLMKASVTGTFAGDIEGDGSSEMLMAYRSESSASFTGLQLVDGRPVRHRAVGHVRGRNTKSHTLLWNGAPSGSTRIGTALMRLFTRALEAGV